LEEIDKRNRKSDESIQLLDIDENCVLHIFILRDQFEQASDKPNQSTFGNKGLSVCVEGGRFGAIDLKSELKNFRARTGKDFVGIAHIKARTLLEENAFFKFVLVHDPYPFVNKDGSLEEQPTNHAQIVCDKDPTGKRVKLMELCEWTLHPSDFNDNDS
jgi:hypothetical protein